MSDGTEPRGSWTADLLVVLLACGFAIAVIGIDPPVPYLRPLVAVPVVLFLPGYAFISALFPWRNHHFRQEEATGAGLGSLERLVLGMLASVAVVPGIAYAINFSPYPIAAGPLIGGITAFTVAFVVLALVRRVAVPRGERYRVSFGGFRKLPSYLIVRDRQFRSTPSFEPRTGGQVLLNLLLIASVIILCSTVGWALVAPQPGETYTEFTLLMEDEEGELVADGYPTTIEAAQSESVYLVIDNSEGEQADYTVVVQYQVFDDGNETESIDESREIDRFDVSAEDGERRETEFEINLDTDEPNSQVRFLLYRGSAPDDPNEDNAYRLIDIAFSE